MSELDEPPAKVLKIDNINGVTHVTEMSEIPEDVGMEIGEVSRDIEGGAENEDGQEEWLSEGVLTDDDYNNPASQDGDRTDSQLGSDDDNPDNTMEQLDTSAESGTNLPGSEANVGLESEANALESEANALESEANTLESEEHLVEMETSVQSQTYTQDNVIESQTYNQDNQSYNMEIEANPMNSEANVTGSVANIVISRANMNFTVQKTEDKTVELSIEETMNHIEGNNAKMDLFDSLLIKKLDVKSEQKNVRSEPKQEEDDGNDTDDLLRMLGEDDSKTKKKLTKTVKDIRAAAAAGDASSDDDDFVYEGATIKKLRAAKNALAKKKPATRAVPEDMGDEDDDTDTSNDETLTVQNVYNLRTPSTLSKNKPLPKAVSAPSVVVKRTPIKTVHVVERTPVLSVKSHSTPKQYHNKNLSSKSILKPTPATTPKIVLAAKAPIAPKIVVAAKAPMAPKIVAAAKTPMTPKIVAAAKTPMTPKIVAATKSPMAPKIVAAAKAPMAPKIVQVKRESGTIINSSFKPPEVKTPALFKSSAAMQSVDQKTRLKRESDEIKDEEFLDDDAFDLNEDEFGESDPDELSKSRQRIMRPEMMDEEMPSDAESHSEDGSLYDELPSSGSEDMDDWFTLDIRAEKAGDYIPLLGPRAKELLVEEKRRVTGRLQTLKQSLSALTDSGKQQAEQLRSATMALAELDDMLKAS